MQRFIFQVFSQTATEQRLRLLDEQGKLLGERSLPQADIERLIAGCGVPESRAIAESGVRVGWTVCRETRHYRPQLCASRR